MKIYHDIGQKGASRCIECGRRPKAEAWGALLDRCMECHNEHMRQVAAVHRAMEGAK